MVDKEIISRHIAELDKIISNLRKHENIKFSDFKNNMDLVWTIEHGLQLAIQNIIDIGGYILSSIGENSINDYSDIISKLSVHNIIPETFSMKIQGMAGFRNILVHEYVDVNLQKVFDVFKNNLDDFIQFVNYIKEYLSAQ